MVADVKLHFQQALDQRRNDRQICISHGFGCKWGIHYSVASTIAIASVLRELGVRVVVEHVQLKKANRDCGCPFSCRNLHGLDTEQVQTILAEWARDGATALLVARRVWEAT